MSFPWRRTVHVYPVKEQIKYDFEFLERIYKTLEIDYKKKKDGGFIVTRFGDKSSIVNYRFFNYPREK